MMRCNSPTKMLVLLAVVVAIVSCASVPPDRATFNTIQTIKASAVSTMTVIGNLYQQGSITEAQKLQAETIYNRLQAGCKAVVAGLSTITTAQQGADLTAPLTQLGQQLSALLLQFQGGAK